jgi:hypothetical protein
MKEQFLQSIEQLWQEGLPIETKEFFLGDGSSIEGKYYFDTLEETLAFFTNEYNDDLIREHHNTQILSWEVKV